MHLLELNTAGNSPVTDASISFCVRGEYHLYSPHISWEVNTSLYSPLIVQSHWIPAAYRINNNTSTVYVYLKEYLIPFV